MIIFLHVVKTGGSTIGAHLEKYYPNYQRLDMKRPPREEGKDFIAGHVGYVWYGCIKDAKYMTIVRDPAEWLVSCYHQDISRTGEQIDFESWYDKPFPNRVSPIEGKRNNQSRYLRQMLGVKKPEEAYSILEKFWFICGTDRLDFYLPFLFKSLDVPTEFEKVRVTGVDFVQDEKDLKVIPKVYELTEEMRVRIYDENPQDVRLYNMFRNRGFYDN